MRTVSFSNSRVRDLLNKNFVCCYTNTEGDRSSGSSFSHAPNDPPGPCGRGAGRQNVQTIFMTPDREIFHVATGFLSPQDLREEATFARNLYGNLRRTDNKQRRRQSVVTAHQNLLRRKGFSNQQITSPMNQLADMMMNGPNPQDFGINIPLQGVRFGGRSSPVRGLFGDIARQRVLKDHKFVMANPLVDQGSFERNPQSLVGNHRSFFGSNAAMNGIGKQINQRVSRFGR